MSEIDSAAWLTLGPRGRRLLWSMIFGGLGPAWLAAFVDPLPPSAAELVAELESAVERPGGSSATRQSSTDGAAHKGASRSYS